MKKTLYRGKRLGFDPDSIIWSTGSLIINECLMDSCPKIYIGPGTGTHIVTPGSVCQFTGLNDCKSREIWEKDIILIRDTNRLLLVKWDENRAAFVCTDRTGNIAGYLHEFAAECEVTDNIVEHPMMWSEYTEHEEI